MSGKGVMCTVSVLREGALAAFLPSTPSPHAVNDTHLHPQALTT